MNYKSKFNLYFASTPVQLICINELRRKDCSENFKLFLFLRENSIYANSQMYLTAELLGFKKYKIYWIPKTRLIRFFNEMLFIFNLKLSLKSNIDNQKIHFVIFDFRSTFLQSLRRYFIRSKFTLIDDGFYTYVAQQNYFKNDIYLPIKNFQSLSGKIAKFLYFGSHYERLKKKSFDIFTIYADEINNKKAQMNKLSYLKEKILIKKRKFDQNKVYFVGTGMVERGVAKLEQELGLLKKLNLFWQKKGKKLYYIGKRRTSFEKLKVFKENGISTITYDLPLELVVTEIDDIPVYFCTLGSTLQKSLYLILGDNIKCFYIDFDDFLKKSPELDSNSYLGDVGSSAAFYSEKSPNIRVLTYEEIIDKD